MKFQGVFTSCAFQLACWCIFPRRKPKELLRAVCNLCISPERPLKLSLTRWEAGDVVLYGSPLSSFLQCYYLSQSNFQIFKIYWFNGAVKSILWLHAVLSPHEALPAPASLRFPAAAELRSPHPTLLPCGDPISVLTPFSPFFLFLPLLCYWSIFFLMPSKIKVDVCATCAFLGSNWWLSVPWRAIRCSQCKDKR